MARRKIDFISPMGTITSSKRSDDPSAFDGNGNDDLALWIFTAVGQRPSKTMVAYVERLTFELDALDWVVFPVR